ncbi:MAG TPA: hypothetical protein VGY30_01785 [Solirubrobacteraceae bacterium]|jgi:hypothetical protein|nr:hypothetical protein [Solirubrobacteraceae bacterium]
MSLPHHSQTPPARPIKFLAAALLGVAAAVLVACGSSGTGLIPAASAGPLQSDFEAVAQAAQSGNGNCLTTESKLGKTEQDFLALPASVDAGLRRRLHEGIANLRKVALAMCAQPSAGATTTTPTTTAPTTTPSTTTTTTTTTPTTTTPTTPTTTTTTPPNNGGGTPAPEESEESSGKGKGKDKGEVEGNSGAAGAGGASPEGGR